MISVGGGWPLEQVWSWWVQGLWSGVWPVAGVLGWPRPSAVSSSTGRSVEGEGCGHRSPEWWGGPLAGPHQLIPNAGRKRLFSLEGPASDPQVQEPSCLLLAKLLSLAGWDNLTVISALEFSVSSGRIRGDFFSCPFEPWPGLQLVCNSRV